MSLCTQCQSFDLQAFRDHLFPYRGYRLSSVSKGAASGCHFCTFLLAALKRSGLPETAFREPLRQLSFWRPLEALWWLATSDTQWLHWTADRDQHLPEEGGVGDGLRITKIRLSVSAGPAALSKADPAQSLQLNVAADRGTPANLSHDVTGKYIRKDTSSDEFVATIRSWLESCHTRNHTACFRTLSGAYSLDPDTAWLPTRCVKVSVDNDGELSLQLERTADRQGKFITLSHRWVQPQTSACQTTTSNAGARMAGTDFAGLRQVFYDIFTLASKLQVDYVWIDAICIIQDDATDWYIESKRMALYYQASWFTLAATDVLSDISLFSADAVDQAPPLTRLPYRDREGKPQGYFYLYPADRMLNKYYWERVSRGALLKRGWVFQEWLLSRRIVCFTRAGLFMQCQEELPTNELGEVVSLQATPRGFVDMSMKRLLGFDLSSVPRVSQAWRSVVEAYSGLELTMMEKDRLVALDGVMVEFDMAFLRCDPSTARFNYAAGLWLGNLHEELLWEKVESGSHVRFLSQPSWTWASIEEAVKWSDRGQCEPRCDIRLSVSGFAMQGPDNRMRLIPFENVEVETTQPRKAASNLIAPGGRPILSVCGQLLSTSVHHRFDGERNVEIAAAATGHAPDFGRQNWRMVTVAQSPKVICGWASIDHTDPADESTFDEGLTVLALHVSTTSGIEGGIDLGYFSITHHAYNVLFVREYAGIPNGYERIGVGRLFGKTIDNAIENLTEQVFCLV